MHSRLALPSSKCSGVASKRHDYKRDFERLPRPGSRRYLRITFLRRKTCSNQSRRTACSVKFIVDAQLPKRLADALATAGHDAIHTLSLPEKNRSTDSAIAQIADLEQRILISKDADFVSSHMVQGTPRYLLEISTGNMPNALLLPLVLSNLDRIELAFSTSTHVEVTGSALVVHG